MANQSPHITMIHHKKFVVKSVADCECHCIFLVTVTTLYNDGHYISATDITTISPGFCTV